MLCDIGVAARIDGMRVMAKKNTGKNGTKTVSAATLGQRDADRFEKSARKYTKDATSSKRKAQSRLISLGIYTKSGRLSKKYG